MSYTVLWGNSGRLTVAWLLLCMIIEGCTALKCGSCNPSTCPFTPLNCTAGTTLDVCACCKVCARAVNESCGGPFGILGRCGEGMECALTPPLGSPITGSERGYCREIIPKNCDKKKCGVSIKRTCPADSKLVQNDTADGCCKHFRCVCNLASCRKDKCLVGFESVLHHKAEGRPGSCCDQYVCQPSEKCRSVMCPWTRGKDCPADSYKLPSKPSDDGCCYQPQGCACKKCPPVLCPQGLQVRVMKEGRGKPGQCCTHYQCVNTTDLTCLSDLTGKEHRNGESWSLDKCSTCTCKSGITYCKRESCQNVTICPYMEIPKDECCPVCKGCLTWTGNVVNNTETWRENDCTTCTCVNGVAQCNSEMCETKCRNPKKIPGQCCPVCDVDESVRQPPPCPDLRNCSLKCPSGFQYSTDGCYVCKCKPKNCYIDCRHGYKLDHEGRELCECAKARSRCPSMSHCTKRCTYGFKVMRNGCTKCGCNKCPNFDCRKKCPNGYMANQQGCKLCKCKVAKPTDNVPATKSPSVVDATCLSVDGVRHEDGDTWHDGCRLCYCYSGQEMCALISCPRPNCISPVFRLGDCCPTCPGNAITLPSTGQHQSCQSAEGLYFVEGETWHLDNCTQCICHNGSVLCETHICPPLLCNYPKLLPGRCCPVCQDEADSLPSIDLPQTRMCRSEAGYSYEHGDIWRTTPCQSCTCRNGQIHCFSQTCAPLKCNRTVLRKGNCCPTCIDFNHSQTCEHRGEVYSPGEEWLTHNCSRCLCMQGEVVCAPLPCPTHNCKYLVRTPDQCCPVCMETTTAVYLNSSPKQPPEGSEVGVTRERGSAEKDSSTTIIIVVLSILVFILFLLFVLGAYKFHRRRQYTEKSPDFNTVDVDTVKPVHVKLLGYECNEKHWNNLPQLVPLHKNTDENICSKEFLKGEKTLNLLSPDYNKSLCVNGEEKNIYL